MRRVALACVATIAVADYLIKRHDPPWLAIGVLDEPAHLATAVLLNPRPSRAYLVGSLLPDIDHVPLAFGSPRPGDPRPKSHSLYAIAPAALVSTDLAAGMLAHFARDLAFAPGVPLLWPLRREPLRIRYGVYALLTVAAALRR